MIDKKQDAPVHQTEAPTEADNRPPQKDFTTLAALTQQAAVQRTPEELKSYLEVYLQGLPPELAIKLRRANERFLNDALEANDSNPIIEGLLPGFKTIDAATILQTKYPPIPWIIPDLLPPGLTFLSGKPKVGKSWLALQLAQAILTGGKFFDRDVEKGKVLYLALEDNERRLQDRMNKQGWPVNPGGVEFMLYPTFREQIGHLNSGGGKRLLKSIEAKGFRLVIIDTFSRAIHGDQLNVSEMTEAVGGIQQYALNKGIGLFVLDHMPKNIGDLIDPIQTVYGSVGKSAVLDTVWGLYKERGKAGAKLAISGRDVKDETLKLTFDPRGFFWNCEGNAYQFDMTHQRQDILDALKSLGKSQLKAIAETAGQPPHHVHERLQDLCNAGLIIRSNEDGGVFYEVKE
jgi:predicted transcriptional regulator/Mrp family chromosome partitioning ATPase